MINSFLTFAVLRHLKLLKNIKRTQEIKGGSDRMECKSDRLRSEIILSEKVPNLSGGRERYSERQHYYVHQSNPTVAPTETKHVQMSKPLRMPK